MKKIKLIMLILLIILVIISVVFISGNNYQMKEKRVSIKTDKNTLSAIITTPKEKKIKGVIVFVHGDGAQNATQDDGYKPLMERFANQGYISVSWDKPGVGKSSGNWLNQTMTDRSNEVSQVIHWMKKHYPEESNKIGLWGSSQAGWVIPKVMNHDSNVDFSILVGPAINWMKQGEYNTGWRVKDQGGNKNEIDKEKKDFITDSQLIKENQSYKDYKNSGGKEKLTKKRYSFIKKISIKTRHLI